MAGAEEVVAGGRRGRAELSGLVLNARGYERLAATALDRVNVTLAATETFNRRNANASLEEATERVEEILARADRPATATISVRLRLPVRGRGRPGVVADLAERLARRARARSCSRTRSASPRRPRRAGSSSGSSIARSAVGGHFHDTRNTGVANAPGRRSRPARRCSTPRSAGSAAARSRRARPATWRPRTCSTCSSARASRPASTSPR